MKKIIEIDTDVVQVMPVDPATQMAMGFAYADAAGVPFSHIGYEAMLAAMPDTLPGVVVHSGEPVAFVDESDDGVFADLLMGKDGIHVKRGDLLFTHPPAQPDTAQSIHYPECWDVAAYPTLESALSEIGAFKCSECRPEQRHGNELYEFLRAMQHGEMSTSRGVELIDIWLAGNYRDDMLPAIGAQPDTAALQARIVELGARLNSARKLAEKWNASAIADGFAGSEPANELFDVLEAQLAAQAGQEPVAWRFVHLGQLFHQSTKPESLDRFEPRHVTPLYAAPANSLAIVQAALESASEVCTEMMRFDAAAAIRAINPQTIIDAARGK